MRKKLTYMALSLMAVACNSVNVEPDLQYGEISVSLGEPEVEVVAKAPTALLPTDADAARYTVRILDESGQLCKDAAGNDCEGTYNNFTTRKLPLGRYYVTAENCSEPAAEDGLGQKRIAGQSQIVELSTSALSQTATVNCAVTNALVTVMFDSSVEGRFTELKVVLTGGSTAGRSLTVNKSDGNTEAWFNPSIVNYTITGRFDAGGVTKDDVSVSGSMTLQARDSKALVVKVNLDNGLLSPSITIDSSLENTEEIPGEFNPYA